MKVLTREHPRPCYWLVRVLLTAYLILAASIVSVLVAAGFAVRAVSTNDFFMLVPAVLFVTAIIAVAAGSIHGFWSSPLSRSIADR